MSSRICLAGRCFQAARYGVVWLVSLSHRHPSLAAGVATFILVLGGLLMLYARRCS